MTTVITGVTALAVVAIYYIWRTYVHELLARRRTLRDRVAYMLWVAASNDTNLSEDHSSGIRPSIRCV